MIPATDPMSATFTTPKPVPSRSAWVWKAVWGLLGLLVLLLLVAHFAAKPIGKMVLKEAQARITTPLKVKDAELRIISTFPSISLDLNGVHLKDDFGKTLLKAKRVSFRIYWWELFSRKKINAVVLEDGLCQIVYNKKGEPNFDILKKSDHPSANSASIELQGIRLKNIGLLYRDLAHQQDVRFKIKSLHANGALNATQFELKSKASLWCEKLKWNKRNWLRSKSIDYAATLTVNTQKKTFRFDKVKLAVAGNEVGLKGSIRAVGGKVQFNTLATGNNINPATLLALFPGELNGFTGQGKVNFNARVKGTYDKKHYPVINIDFGLKQGKLSGPGLEGPVTKIAFKGKFTNEGSKRMEQAKFVLSSFAAQYAGIPTRGYFSVQQFNDPLINLQLSGNLPVAVLSRYLNHPLLENATGAVAVKDLQIRGRLKEMNSTTALKSIHASGSAQFQDVNLKFRSDRIKVPNGNIAFSREKVEFNNFHVLGAGSDLQIDASCQHLLPRLFSAEGEDAKAINFQATAKANTLDASKIAYLVAPPVSEFTERGSNVDSAQLEQMDRLKNIMHGLHGQLSLEIQRAVYQRIQVKNFKGHFQFQGPEIEIKAAAQAMQGSIQSTASFTFRETPALKAKVFLKQLDIQRLFYECENFGQSVIGQNHLRGRLSAQTLVQAYWDKWGAFRPGQLRVLSDMHIANGELYKFDMLYSFSKYIKIQDLQHIKFTDLYNLLEVSNRTVHIPVMFLQSNAMNLTVCGKHTWANDIDYHLKVNAEQILMNKFKKHNNRLDPLPAENGSGLNLYYRIYGHTSNYQYGQNRPQVMNAFTESENRRDNVRRELMSAFGQLLQPPVTATAMVPSTSTKEKSFRLGDLFGDLKSGSKQKPSVAQSNDEVEFLEFDETPAKPKPEKKNKPFRLFEQGNKPSKRSGNVNSRSATVETEEFIQW